MIGQTVAHYDILEKIGEGGMGEVYRARDTKLNRDVALKILPQVFAQDSQRMARFEREAQVLASLNHSHIAQIHGLEETDGTKALVLELVEGETLQEQIARGPIPVDEALKIALQITEGLEAAHDKGIIHRDLKPANIKITPEGAVKILDFGLAKALEGETPVSDLSHSPTITHAATEAGVILGTASYMSPEQARGKPVDKRTDIWAFGCVLYEMLTGKKAFGGDAADETVSDVLAAVLRAEPDWVALQCTNPTQLRFLLERCLEKDTSRRFRDIGDVAIQMHAALESTEVQQARGASYVPSKRLGPAFVATLAVSAAIIGAAAVWLFGPSRTEEPKQVIRFILPLHLHEGEKLGPGWGNPPFCLSPMGALVAYLAESGSGSKSQVYLRSLESMEANMVLGSQNGREPFFSPDGAWLGFAVQTSSGFVLKKVPVGRGQALTLVDSIANHRGFSWGDDNSIVFAPGLVSGLSMVSADGGEPQSLTSLGPGEPGHRWPQMLPGGRGVLYTIAAEAGWAEAKIAVQDLDSRESSILVEGGTFGRYLPTGHLVYFRQGTLMAVPFDLQKMQLRGSPIPVVEGISQHSSSSAPRASISKSGTLAYLSQAAAEDLGMDSRSIVLVNRDRKVETLSERPRPYLFPAFSPDGQRVAMNISSSTQGVWILDTSSKSLRPLNDGLGSLMPVWTPDGSKIVYFSKQAGARGLYWQTSDFREEAERLTKGIHDHRPSSFTPDGKFLAYTEMHPTTDGDIWILPLEDERPAWPYLQSEFFEGGAMFSPDGEWLAYSSDKSGQFEVFIRPFPGPGVPQQVSNGGGQQPLWSHDGEELFFLDNEQKQLMVIEFKDQQGIGARNPTPLVEFERPVKVSPPIRSIYDVSPDGERFLIVQELDPTGELVPINIVLHWFEELKRLVPTE